MKRSFTLFNLAILVLLFSSPGHAQNEANIWYFGTNAGMDFNGGNPVPLTNGQLNTFEGCATIADASTGQLLFYTDGSTVYNRNHMLMTNGNGLLGSFSSTQSSIIVPHPGQTNLFYIIAADDVAGPNGVTYSIVDMNQSGGFGAVTATKNVSLLGVGTEKLTTACHGNGTDYWVITHGWNSSDFYAWQVGLTGLNPTPVISTSGSFHGTSSFNTLGELEVSPDASRIALCTWYGTINEVFDFNNNTGVVSNAISLTATGEDYGCAFSPDGSKVYYVSCCASPNNVVQYDLNAGTPAQVNASRTVISSTTLARGHAQIGPDGRVYIARYLQADIAVIDNPNAAGAACNYTEIGFNLGGRISQLGLPNMVSCLIIIFDLEFITFHGERQDQGAIDLYWEAVEERQQGEYVVERSPDGAYFYPIGEVPFRGKGEVVAARTYTDADPLPGSNYYRIRFVNANGENSVSEVLEIQPEQDLHASITVSPNPVPDQLQLQIAIPETSTGNWEVELIAADGKLVRHLSLGSLAPGRFQRQFDVRRLSPGYYYLRVRNGQATAVQSLVKQ
ncbi:MAG: T9SS type A sorting domain-containing protein [Bacteroidota bacterium]